MTYLILWTKNQQRFYRVELVRDLLGDYVLVRSWGSLKNRVGGTKYEIVKNIEEGRNRILLITKRRQRRQYELLLS